MDLFKQIMHTMLMLSALFQVQIPFPNDAVRIYILT